jgi:hypothetical protein
MQNGFVSKGKNVSSGTCFVLYCIETSLTFCISLLLSLCHYILFIHIFNYLLSDCKYKSVLLNLHTGRPKGKELLGRLVLNGFPRLGYEIVVLVWIHLAQDRNQEWAVLNTATNLEVS